MFKYGASLGTSVWIWVAFQGWMNMVMGWAIGNPNWFMAAGLGMVSGACVALLAWPFIIWFVAKDEVWQERLLSWNKV